MLTAILVLIAFSIAPVVAGHGALPMAALLVTGGADTWWASGRILGWIGVVALVAVTLALRSAPSRLLVFQFLASTILYLSWLVSAILGNGESGSFWSSFVLSIPFQITFLVVACRAIFRKRVRAGANRAPSAQ